MHPPRHLQFINLGLAQVRLIIVTPPSVTYTKSAFRATMTMPLSSDKSSAQKKICTKLMVRYLEVQTWIASVGPVWLQNLRNVRTHIYKKRTCPKHSRGHVPRTDNWQLRTYVCLVAQIGVWWRCPRYDCTQAGLKTSTRRAGDVDMVWQLRETSTYVRTYVRTYVDCRKKIKQILRRDTKTFQNRSRELPDTLRPSKRACFKTFG